MPQKNKIGSSKKLADFYKKESYLKKVLGSNGSYNVPIYQFDIFLILDPVMNALRRCHLFNNHHDRVKVVLRKKGFFKYSLIS